MASRTFRYLIIGGGMTADAAVRGIRQGDADGSIGLISNESIPPYNRPPLSKGLWKRTRLEHIWRGTEKLGVDLFLNTTAVGLDPASKLVRDERGQDYHYEKLLLATGGSPNRLLEDGGRVIYLRYLPDYLRLRALSEQKTRFIVIGGGFIGPEIAAALAMRGKEVKLLFSQAGIGARFFPEALSHYLTDYFRQKGVQVLPGSTVIKVEAKGEQALVRTASGEEHLGDAVIAGLGIHPNIELARQPGLEINNGILVDSCLRTSLPDIYAAGDVISFFNHALGKSLHVEHEEHANQSGLLAGQAMAGSEVCYDFLPMAYSDLFELGYQSVGEIDSTLQMVEDWPEIFHKGTIYYLQNGRVRGVLLWNTWGQIQTARDLIAAPGPISPADLVGRIR